MLNCEQKEKRIKSFYCDLCYLNDGSGDPIAGHNKLKERSDFSVKVKVSDFCENFGFDPPIGSTKVIIISICKPSYF